jgi:hypothetical protein
MNKSTKLIKRTLVKSAISVILTFNSIYLTGCATELISTAQLQKPTERAIYLLGSEYEYISEFRGAKRIYILPSGRYIAEFRNSNGTLLRADGLKVKEISYTSNGERSNTWIHEGGIFLPFDPNGRAIVYTYLDQNPPIGDLTPTAVNAVLATPNTSIVSAGVGAGLGMGIVAALVEADKGKIVFTSNELPNQKPLRITMMKTAE